MVYYDARSYSVCKSVVQQSKYRQKQGFLLTLLIILCHITWCSTFPQVRDSETGYVFGSVKVPISRILEDGDDLKLPLEDHELATKENNDNGGVVKFSAKLRL